jgi:hypothetical protein
VAAPDRRLPDTFAPLLMRHLPRVQSVMTQSRPLFPQSSIFATPIGQVMPFGPWLQ